MEQFDNINDIDSKRQNNKEELISWAKWIVSAFIIAFILRTFVFQMAIVNQISMEPTLVEGQMLVISKINYMVTTPKRGDIIVFKDDNENKLLIKRIIGLPNEEIEVKDNRVYTNNELLDPDYTAAPTNSYSKNQWTIPEGTYFVMGDNRPHSRDSRTDSVGFVKRESFVGRAIFRVWPFNKIGILK